MSSTVELIDNSINVKSKIKESVIEALYEAAGEVQAQTVRAFDNAHKDQNLSNIDKQLKGSYSYYVDENEGKAVIGSPMEAAYWEEFGTGSHAEHGDGRKGWWVYIEDGGNGSGGKSYATEEEAIKAAKFLRSKGLKAHATNGKDPNRTLRTGFDKSRELVKKRFEKELENNV